MGKERMNKIYNLILAEALSRDNKDFVMKVISVIHELRDKFFSLYVAYRKYQKLNKGGDNL